MREAGGLGGQSMRSGQGRKRRHSVLRGRCKSGTASGEAEAAQQQGGADAQNAAVQLQTGTPGGTPLPPSVASNRPTKDCKIITSFGTETGRCRLTQVKRLQKNSGQIQQPDVGFYVRGTNCAVSACNLTIFEKIRDISRLLHHRILA